ncbi:unnamed protein product [Dracunculus medinensis]|uniref:Peptidase_S9 domain-containing protein n=1 Tax=Dracunculus medinensis TaxID=318479 RepID=A0A0N4U8M2_DRAME|nr:unnamed protein product [Dracunculus medinensis]
MALGVFGQQQKLYRAAINSSTTIQPISTLPLLPFLPQQSSDFRPPPMEIVDLCERQRATITCGLSFYNYDLFTQNLLYSDSWNLFCKRKDEEIRSIGCKIEGCPLFAESCPVDPNIIAFVANSNVHIDYNGKIIYSTKSNNGVINGVPSFISQEEFDRFTAIWWSPGPEKMLLYEKVDEKLVTELQFTCPGHMPSPIMRYPLAGMANAKSSLRLIVISATEVFDNELKVDLKSRFPWYEYLARVGWTADGSAVWAILMSRLQERYELILIPKDLFTEASSGNLKDIISLIHEETNIWFNVHNLTHFLHPVDGAITFLHSSSLTDHTHLSLYKAKIFEAITHYSFDGCVSFDEMKVTRGDWSIIKNVALHVDTKRHHVYFLANKHHVADTNVSERVDDSHWLNPEIGFVCWESSLKMPPRCSFYRILQSYDKCLPSAVLQHVLEIAGELPREPPSSLIASQQFPELIEFDSRNSGKKHYALLLRPSNIALGTRYPVIQFVYGGPGIQLVRNIWAVWSELIKFTSLGYAVVMVDGRGSANRGISFEAHLKYKLGTVEIDDQIEGLNEVAKRAKGLLDLNRVAIKGWSYGGYLALLSIAKYPHIYRACVAGAAVACWDLYDTAYTERYLGLPSFIYEEASVLSYINQLPDEENRLLLIHGLLDENVHFSHTQRLIEALIAAGKPYNLQIFPSEHHGIRSSNANDFCDATVLQFLRKALSS